MDAAHEISPIHTRRNIQLAAYATTQEFDTILSALDVMATRHERVSIANFLLNAAYEKACKILEGHDQPDRASLASLR